MIPLDPAIADVPVELIMHSGLLTCSPHTPLYLAAERMANRRCSSMLIVEKGTVLGIWTEHDSLRLNFNDPASLHRPISELMSSPVATVNLHTPVSEVVRRFNAEHMRHFLVIDDRARPQGIVSQTDIALKRGIELYLSLRKVSDSMDPDLLLLPGHLSLSQTATLMLEQRQDAAVVQCAEQTFGIITERDMVRFAARHPGDTQLHQLATSPLRTIDADASLLKARDLLIDYHIRHLAVRDPHSQRIVGLLGFRHILAGAEPHQQLEISRALQRRDQALIKSHLTLQLAERVIEASLEGVMITDTQGHIEFVNPAFTHNTGYLAEEVLGKKPSLLSSGRHDGMFYKAMWEAINNKGFWRGEIWNRRKDGQLYLELLTITSIHDEQNKLSHYAGLFRDITHLRENEEHIRRLAYYDALTQLPNRRLLEDRLALAVHHAHRYQEQLAVLFIDLDHFKQINDTLGHAGGDELLLEVARRLENNLREGDTLARLGGDEFIVLLPDLAKQTDLSQIARRFLAAIAAPFRFKQQSFRIGCSLGISIYPDDAKTPEQLIQNADAAMYRAKQEGRNTYRLYSQHMDLREHHYLAMETALRNAIDSGEGLSLHYQPQVTRRGKRVASLEALARWYHPEFKQVSPGDFIPLAERAGLILPLSQRLMNMVLAQLRTWLDAGLEVVPVAINLSAQQLWQPDFVDQVQAGCDYYQVPTKLLHFELTESILLDKQQQAPHVLQQLRELGCAIAMDDFGTGYSSLSYLHQLPINTLKIDQSFIQQLGQNQGSETILAAITGLARGLKLTVVAEGVETEAQHAALDDYHVDFIQGYLTGRPMPSEQIVALGILAPQYKTS